MSATAPGQLEVNVTVREPTVLLVRLAAGLVQSAALYLLVWSADPRYTWPATAPRIFVPLILVSAFVPLMLSVGIGRVPTRPLAIWLAVATVIIAGLGYHDIARGAVPPSPAQVVFWPRFQLGFALFVGLFVAHILVTDSIVERRLLASYTRHFDQASKLSLQVALSAVFVGVVWTLLHLGAELFRLVNVGVFSALIQRRWFEYLATGLAVAVAIHVTDIQPGLIRGARSLALTLFSWLLPLLSVILLGFLGILPFVSLAPLWKTHFATSLLLAAAGAIIFLINCCYQDGAAEQVKSPIRRLAGTLGAIELVPLAGLAVWGLGLRVSQYGWSTDRIFAAAVVGVACCFAIGYFSATINARDWLQRLETTNVVTAWVSLALILALFSPIADPARLMVADQLARLKSGAVRPTAFDFGALKFDGARWGAAALTDLSQTGADRPDAAAIRSAATRAISMENRYTLGQPPLPEAAASHVDVFPSGRALPPAFLDAATWSFLGNQLPVCLRSNNQKCSALFVTLRPGEPEALIFFGVRGTTGAAPVFQPDQSGQWRQTAQLIGPVDCPNVPGELARGEVATEPHGSLDLTIGGRPMVVAPLPAQCGAPISPAP